MSVAKKLDINAKSSTVQCAEDNCRAQSFSFHFGANPSSYHARSSAGRELLLKLASRLRFDSTRWSNDA
jgi:hypothetical protein